MNKKCITDVDVNGKKCLVRVDFNVPLDENNNVTDDNRIIGALPTINYLIQHGAKVILCSHLGRPKGKFNPKYSLKPCALRLSELLNKPIVMAEDVIGESAHNAVNNMKNGDVVMLENLRFHAEEEENEKGFCKELSSFAEVYVNDAFGTAHRAHASTAGVTAFVKDAVSGFLIQKELEVMGGALEEPKRPFIAILGGSKVSDKIGVISNLINKVDALLIGGGMAYTFYKAMGYDIGKSLCENDKVELAKELIAKAKANNVELLLPIDNIVAREFNNDAEKMAVSTTIPNDFMALDIGPNTIAKYSKVINLAKTIIWNGPLGVFEMENFSKGTFAIAKAIAESKAVSIIGGGDSAAAVIQMGFRDQITHISTGGGASLEFLEGLVLPGIDCLNNK